MEFQKTFLYLVRHAKTDFNPEERLYGSDEPELNEIGQAEALSLVRWFIDKDEIRAIYSSSSVRAEQTAKGIANNLNVKFSLDSRLRERDLGLWEGLSWSEIKESYPKEWGKWRRGVPDFSPSGGESLNDFCQRVNSLIKQIVKKHQGQGIIVITHAGPIRCVLKDILSISLSKFFYLYPETGSITKLEYGQDYVNIVFFSYQPT